MSPFQIFLLASGIIVIIFGILTFTGRTALSKRSFYISGIELDKSVTGITIFLTGMLMVVTFLIQVLGPHFKKGGM